MKPRRSFGAGVAVNRTRKVVLAGEMRTAKHFLARLVGLLAVAPGEFGRGRGLWIVPSHGVHCMGMRYAVDAVYLDRRLRVIHLEAGLRPWRLGAVRYQAASVLELPAGTIAASGTAVGDQIGMGEAADRAAQ